jgi:hypothetical protein
MFIIMSTARQRAAAHTDDHFIKHCNAKLRQYSHILVSPAILAILALLHLGITFSMDCKKSSRRFWFHLLGYFISFIPSVLVFIIFVAPSKIYRAAFHIASKRLRRRISSFQWSFVIIG